jgi:choline-sulfatase
VKNDSPHILILFSDEHSPHYHFVCPEPLFSHYRSLVELPSVSEEDVSGLHPAYRAKIDKQHPWPNTRDEQLNAIAAYCGMIEHMDTWIGRALSTLEELGVRDEFIVLHWSDHGDVMGEHGQWWKRSFYEASICVPFAFSGPGTIASGHEVAEDPAYAGARSDLEHKLQAILNDGRTDEGHRPSDEPMTRNGGSI